MFFIDEFKKTLELTETEIHIQRPDDKYGHGYNRVIPYTAIDRVVFQEGSFFNYGFFSLITMTGGVTYNKCNLRGDEFASAVDDETTFMFDKKNTPEVEKMISIINQRRSCAGEKSTTLSEFWGMTYKEKKNSTATLLPEGIKYSRNGSAYTLTYSEILKLEFAPQGFQIVIMRKGLDSKIRLQQFKRTHMPPDEDAKYCLRVNINDIWAGHFFKALNIIVDNRHLIPYSRNNTSQTSEDSIWQMNGYDFEQFCSELLRKNGFTDVDVTPKSSDQGVDILAVKDGVRYAIQCKYYSSSVGNSSVQEVHAGKMFYNCHVGVVMTNSEFSPGAISLATATGVLLWDGAKIRAMM